MKQQQRGAKLDMKPGRRKREHQLGAGDHEGWGLWEKDD